MGLIDKARDVYSRRRKKGDLWSWAKKPERDGRRVKRWKALADLANQNRSLNRSLGRLVQAKAWAEARGVYRKKFQYLEKKIEDSKPPPFSNDGTGWAVFDGKNVPAWMGPWLTQSRDAGWGGVVVSGVRTPEYSEQLCYNMCGAPSCPGRCAGRASNHNMLPSQGYPYGALDVSDYYNFGAIQKRIGSPLINALGAQDPVHFSVSGR